jgi:hypothetical protein
VRTGVGEDPASRFPARGYLAVLHHFRNFLLFLGTRPASVAWTRAAEQPTPHRQRHTDSFAFGQAAVISRLSQCVDEMRGQQQHEPGVAHALHRHLHWQTRQLEAARRNASAADGLRFLVLRPGDRGTVCTTPYLASGKCGGGRPYVGYNGTLGAAEHWDTVLTAGRPELRRLLPGLGNIAAALASSAAVAILSHRILLVENWTVAAESYAAPLPALLLERSGWGEILLRAQAHSRYESFITSDDTSLASTLCTRDLRAVPSERVWRVFSNQYFLPLMAANERYRPQIETWIASGGGGGVGLWAPLARALLRPLPHVQSRIDTIAGEAFPTEQRPPSSANDGTGDASTSRSSSSSASDGVVDARTSSDAGGTLSMHLRCMETLNGFCHPLKIALYAACAVERLNATRATRLFVATMHARDAQTLREGIRRSLPSVSVITSRGEGGRMAERVETGTQWQEESRITDTWLLALGNELLLSPASTMGYLAMSLTDAPATMLNTCKPPPTREASFHLLRTSLKKSRACAEEAVRARLGVGAGGRHATASPSTSFGLAATVNVSARLQRMWDASLKTF